MLFSSQNFLFVILVPKFQHCCQIDHFFPLLFAKLLLSLIKPRRITYVNSINLEMTMDKRNNLIEMLKFKA